METMHEKIDKLLLAIPYDKIREKAFVNLDKADLIKGNGKDIGLMAMEQVDIFKMEEMKDVKQKLWDICFRQIRKTMNTNIVEWTQKRTFEEHVKESMELGEAAMA